MVDCNTITVEIQPSKECYVLVSGVVHNSSIHQRCTITPTAVRHDPKNVDQEPSRCLEGRGSKDLMLDGQSTSVVLGPYPYGAILKLVFEQSWDGNHWVPSNALGKVETQNKYKVHHFEMLFQLSTCYASTLGDKNPDCEVTAFTVV